jgi:hypothetical protein
MQNPKTFSTNTPQTGNFSPLPDLWDGSQTAAYLRVNRRKVGDYVKAGLPAYKIGKRHLFRPLDVVAWVQSHAVNASV